MTFRPLTNPISMTRLRKAPCPNILIIIPDWPARRSESFIAFLHVGASCNLDCESIVTAFLCNHNAHTAPQGILSCKNTQNFNICQDRMVYLLTFEYMNSCQILPKIAFRRKVMTPKMASPKMDEFILLVPRRRFTKMIGTSTILNLRRYARNFISIWNAYPLN